MADIYNKFKNLRSQLLHSQTMMPKAKWHKLLEREVIIAHKKQQPISVIFIDIDNLKYTNDTFGHAEGDYIINELQQAILLIENNFRTRHKGNDSKRLLDIITVDTPRGTDALITEIEDKRIEIKPGRIGGDEFAVLCHTDEGGVEIIVNRLRDTFRGAISQKLRSEGVDISIGVSTLKPDMTVSDLLRFADEKLYSEKASHLPKLKEEDIVKFRQLVKALKRMNIRPRDMSKYEALYAKDFINK